jgi:hypothetical protein
MRRQSAFSLQRQQLATASEMRSSSFAPARFLKKTRERTFVFSSVGTFGEVVDREPRSGPQSCAKNLASDRTVIDTHRSVRIDSDPNHFADRNARKSVTFFPVKDGNPFAI